MINKKYQNLSCKTVDQLGLPSYLRRINRVNYINSYAEVLKLNRGTELVDKFLNSLGKLKNSLYNFLIKSADNSGDIHVKEYKKNKINNIKINDQINYLNENSFIGT